METMPTSRQFTFLNNNE